MNIKEAEAITHTLSKPGKMPGFAYSTPAHECKTGTKLRAIPNSVCANCYAYERGRYRFQNVKDAQYKRYAKDTPRSMILTQFINRKQLVQWDYRQFDEVSHFEILCCSRSL